MVRLRTKKFHGSIRSFGCVQTRLQLAPAHFLPNTEPAQVVQADHIRRTTAATSDFTRQVCFIWTLNGAWCLAQLLVKHPHECLDDGSLKTRPGPSTAGPGAFVDDSARQLVKCQKQRSSRKAPSGNRRRPPKQVHQSGMSIAQQRESAC